MIGWGENKRGWDENKRGWGEGVASNLSGGPIVSTPTRQVEGTCENGYVYIRDAGLVT